MMYVRSVLDMAATERLSAHKERFTWRRILLASKVIRGVGTYRMRNRIPFHACARAICSVDDHFQHSLTMRDVMGGYAKFLPRLVKFRHLEFDSALQQAFWTVTNPKRL